MKSDKPNIAFIIEGGTKHGYGHLFRTLGIAEYLSQIKKCEVIYIINDKKLGQIINQKLKLNYYLFDSLSIINNSPKNIYEIINKLNVNSIVFDIKSHHNPSIFIKYFRKQNPSLKFTLIDNVTSARLLVDNNIYPIPKVLTSVLNWNNHQGNLYSGLKYYPLRQDFTKLKTCQKSSNSIVISFGASDPNNISLKVMKALKGSQKVVKIILGPGNKHTAKIEAMASKYAQVFKIYHNPSNYAQLIATSSIAFTALGTSIYDFLYLKTPAIVIANYPEDTRIGKILDENHYCQFLDYYQKVTQKQIQIAISNINKKNFKFSTINKNGINDIGKIVLQN
jgi:spore coat polysaccharide biosynthesis predicted glycosyltransferase SpsG